MEQALYISRLDNLKFMTDDFLRLYYGMEFCERLLPQPGDLDRAIAYARERKLGFTFVTPFVTCAGLDRLEALLAGLAAACPGAEVVFNDWGVLQLLRAEFPVLEPVLGRLLNKSKRGPRIMNIIDQVPPETRDYFRGSNLDVPAAVRFLRQNGISRVEFDNLLQGLDLATAEPLHLSLYLPFAYVSATRFCLTAQCDEPSSLDHIGVFPCGRQCREYHFNLYNPVMKLPLVRKGNALFFVNEEIPEAVPARQIDRIVVQPEIPV